MSNRLPQRKHLHHDTPIRVSSSVLFFITLNGNPRGLNQFASDHSGNTIIASAKFHHNNHNWFCRLLVIMPDHIHALVAFPPDTSMKRFITSWKSYLSKELRIQWQRDFFDHRIRSYESLEAKTEYIRNNPIRAGLGENYIAWPWKWEPDIPAA